MSTPETSESSAYSTTSTTKNLNRYAERFASKSAFAEKDCVQMMKPANIHDNTVTTSRMTVTIDMRFDAYSSAPRLPSRFFTDMYTGRNAVMIMPPMTSSYSWFGRLFATV